MGLKSSERTSANTFEIIFNVGAEVFENACEKIFRKNQSRINIPGFRKGKAPRKVIEKYYGAGFFYEEAVEEVFPQAYEASIEEAGIEPVARPKVDVLSIGKDGVEFKALVYVKPEVKIGEYKGLKAKTVVVEVSDEEINSEIEKMRARVGRLVDVTDRPAQMNDQVVIDYEGFCDGVAFEGGKAEKHSLLLGSGQFIPGFEEQVCGHKIGEEFEIKVTFPEDYHSEDLAGKETVFKIKLHEIKEKELPDLDDEFAKDVSEFESLEELKNSIREKIRESKEKFYQDNLEIQLFDKILESFEAEVPEVMYESAIDNMVSNFDYRLQMQGLNLDKYLQYTGMDMASFRKTFYDQASKQVKMRLALEKIVELENIVPSQEQIDQEINKLADTYNIEVEKAKNLLSEKDVSEDLAVNMAIQLIKDNAVIENCTEEEFNAMNNKQ